MNRLPDVPTVCAVCGGPSHGLLWCSGCLEEYRQKGQEFRPAIKRRGSRMAPRTSYRRNGPQRHKQILQLLAQGLKVQAVAKVVGLADHSTVLYHRDGRCACGL